MDNEYTFVWVREYIDLQQEPYAVKMPIYTMFATGLDDACRKLVAACGDEFREGEQIVYIYRSDNGITKSGWARVMPVKQRPQWYLDTGMGGVPRASS